MRIASRILIILFTAVMAGCLTVGVGPLTIGPPANSGLPLLYADPGVSVVRADDNEIAYEPGMVLLQGDTIRTYNGQAVIDFDDGHVVALQTGTQIQLGSIRLFFGELFARMEKLVERGGARVETNELTASVEGTEFAVRRTAPDDPVARGTSAVIVRRGTVRCAPVRDADWRPVSLGADQRLQVYGPRESSTVTRVDALAETRWADETIRRLLQPRSSRPSVGIHIPIGGTAAGPPDAPHPKYDD